MNANVFDRIDFEERLLTERIWKIRGSGTTIEARYDVGLNYFLGENRIGLRAGDGSVKRIPVALLIDEDQVILSKIRRFFPISTIQRPYKTLDSFIDFFLDYFFLSCDRLRYNFIVEQWRRLAFSRHISFDEFLLVVNKTANAPLTEKEAEDLLLLAACEDAFAQFLLYQIRLADNKCRRNDGLLQKSAEQGLSIALFELAELYYWGDCVEENERAAVQFLIKAADRDDARAQYQLALCYKWGRGTEINPQEVKRWIVLARRGGFKPSEEICDELGITIDSEPDVTSAVETSKKDSSYDNLLSSTISTIVDSRTIFTDVNEKIALLNRYYDRGEYSSRYYCALLAVKCGNIAEAVGYLRDATEKDVPVANFQLARVLELDSKGMDALIECRNLYKRSLYLGLIEAKERLDFLECNYLFLNLDSDTENEPLIQPVDSLQLGFSNGLLWLRWKHLEKGSVLFFYLKKELVCNKRLGKISLNELKKILGEPFVLSEGQNGDYYTNDERFKDCKRFSVLPITFESGTVSIGTKRNYVVLKPIKNLTLIYSDEGTYATWDWEPSVDGVVVLSNWRRLPKGLKDCESKQYFLSRATYENNGGLLLTKDNATTIYFQLFQIATMEGESFYSEGVSFSSRQTFISYHKQIRMKTNVNNSRIGRIVRGMGLDLWNKRVYEGAYLVFESDDGKPIPEIIIVRQTQRPPLRRDDGDIVATIPASANGRQVFRLDDILTSSNSNAFFRCYLAKPTAFYQYALLDPSDDELKLDASNGD